MSRPTLRRLASATALSALVVGLLPASAASAAPRNIEAFACPAGEVPDPGFSDDAGFAEDAIHCIVWYGVAGGTSGSTYSPEALVGRGAMAKFIANVLAAGDVALPAEPADAFEDDENSPFEHFINQLAELGVVDGTSETTYEPANAVRRDQMASYLARAYEEVTGTALPEGENAFDDDDGKFHEPNINRVAAAGIAAGTSARTYSPEEQVRRDQMAVFIARLLDLLVEEGYVEVPRGDGNNQTALDVPELLRVERANATTVRFVFDEALSDTVATQHFALYGFDATRFEASSTSRVGSDTVLATFTEDAVANATLAAVAEGAVQDADANLSPEGDAALQDVELSEGSTVAPDLLAVEAAENTATFTFDEAAFNVEPTGYHLILSDGTKKDSTAVSGGDGTTEHNVTFALTAEEASRVAYGYVDDGTVSDAAEGGDANVLQEAHVSASGTTQLPDLVSAEVVDATTVRYVFDENVTRTTGDPVRGAPGDLRVYFTDATTATAESSERTANNTITATFAEGVLNEFVSGAIVDAGTAQGANGTNQAAEVGFALSFQAGDTAAPELLSATIGEETADDGTVTRKVRYLFDEEVTEILDGSRFKVYAQDGSSMSFRAATTFPPSDGSCTVDAENAKVVECVADDSETERFAFLENAVVAAVERGAVESEGGHANAEGAVVLTEATTTA
ncbi:MAG: S-layer homology domain-containing protein [Actinobacteria bacterium]|nr:S-layer homology domain-containing protein [Actinomycetota bacterium]